MSDSTILETYRVQKQEGEVGLEIEVEGSGFRVLPTYWRKEEDGSLAGHNGRPGESAEYVLSKPVPREKVEQVLDYLNRKFAANDTQVVESERTSVHVHINVQELTRTQALNYILLYLIFEDVLIEQCGPGRKGNNFCLSASDAEYLLSMIKSVITTKNWGQFASRDLRYSAINLAAMPKYGSLEFRSMRGTIDKAIICHWVSVLLMLKDAAIKFKEPKEIMESLSSMGPKLFMTYIFGNVTSNLIRRVPDWQDRVQRGVWNVQDIAFKYTLPAQPKSKSNYVIADAIENEIEEVGLVPRPGGLHRMNVQYVVDDAVPQPPMDWARAQARIRAERDDR
jgi:hypothetical protein